MSKIKTQNVASTTGNNTDNISKGQTGICSSYDKTNGRCRDSGKLCDACYESSLKISM